MRKTLSLLFAICLVGVTLYAKTPSKKPVYKVTKVVATISGNVVTTEADGEVSSTGWKYGELRAAKGTADTLVYTFVATPPSGITSPVITPIPAAPKKTGPLLPPFPTKVKVIAKTNDLVVDIVKR